jgi:hypothetical protein
MIYLCIFDSRANARIQEVSESRSVRRFLDPTAAFRAICKLTGSVARLIIEKDSTTRAYGRTKRMANLVLVYGMRLLPADEVKQVGSAPVALQNGNEAQVTMHVLEGSREQIENQLKQSIDAFFDFYPEI